VSSGDDKRPGLGRRELLTGLGAAAVASALPTRAALTTRDINRWDLTTDVLVAGSGAAGLSAALAARAEGASVLVLEVLPRFGGSSGMSGGVVYAGGGTALQKSLGVKDSPEEMYAFIVGAGSPHAQLDKIEQYCIDSVAHFDWLVEMGVPYSNKFTAAKGLPMGDESLYFSGNEQAWPAREIATPIPRGHVPGVVGMTGGRTLMAALLARARAAGIGMQSRSAGERLILERDGSVAGMRVDMNGESRNIRARHGVVLASGGFIHNREMLTRYAPELANCSVPWGNAGDRGDGIVMGMAAGGATLRMHHGFAIVPVYPPEHVLSGIIVNAQGQRFVAEDSYHGVLGHNVAYHQGGKAWLITDEQSSFGFHQDNFVQVARANTIGDLAVAAGFPQSALQHTVAYYNRFAASGRDPLFHKSQQYLRPVQGPPYRAWNLSVDKAFFPAHTFGGLQTTVDGEVVNAFGEAIAGLYAVGRTSAGLPMAPYIASGLSVGDCTYFGRRAGRHAGGMAA